ncbi:TRAP transporter small permease subunit [Roseovarius nanhaiticus]|uniref:TRAP transporter small permease subunit n=1 Tax=Roseovarius nanhaiticus TaxID=573024 RepID=UPI002492084D|nr:TRAP transporter small permease subunit [Roseovarius nanhaiticus]
MTALSLAGIARLERAVLNGFAVLLIVLMLAIAVQVVASFFDLNPLVMFDAPVAWLGRGITLNSLLDLQWHLLAIIALLPAGLVWLRDRHVRVDFLYDGYRPKLRYTVDLIGNLVFAAPFLIMAIPGSVSFWQRAWRAGEGSASGGLNDLWLIKAMLPLGLGLLAAAALIESLRLAAALVRG